MELIAPVLCTRRAVLSVLNDRMVLRCMVMEERDLQMKDCRYLEWQVIRWKRYAVVPAALNRVRAGVC